MANIKQVKIGSTPYDIEALHFNAGENLDTPAQWKAYIDSIGDLGFEIFTDLIGSTLPEANATSYAKYKNGIVLCNNGETPETGSYIEWVIVRTGTSSSYSYAWEKIGTTSADLTDYVKKNVEYSGAALSNGKHTHTVTVPTINVDKTLKLGATATGTAVNPTKKYLATTSVTGVSGSTTASKAAAGTAFNAVKTVSISGESATATGRVAYVSEVSAPSLSGTKTFVTAQGTLSGGSATGTFNTDAIKSATLDVKTTSTSGYQEIVTTQGTLSGGSATGTFNTDAIKDVTLSASATSTDGPQYLQDVSHTAASLTGTTTFATGGMIASVSDGVLSFTAAGTGTVGISGGSITKTTKYMKHVNTNASTGSVAYTAPTLGAATKKYIKVTTAPASTADVAYTAPTLGDATTGTVGITGGTATTKYLAVGTTTESVTPYTFTDVTVPKAATATTVATGAIAATGTSGNEVVTAVSVSANPTITITEATTNTGPVNEHVTTGTASATTSENGAHAHNVKVTS